MLVNLLDLAQQDVRFANDGKTALQTARDYRPQLILLDVSMPEMDGREVARQLRADPRTASAFIVAVTGFSPNEVLLDLSSTGFDERVTKPLEYEALLTLLQRARHNA